MAPRTAVSVLQAALIPNMHALDLPRQPAVPRSSTQHPIPHPSWLPPCLLSLPPPLQPLISHACASVRPGQLTAVLDLSAFPAVPPAPAVAPVLAGRTALVLRLSRPAAALPAPAPTPACSANRTAVLAAVCCARNLIAVEFTDADRGVGVQIARALPASTHLRALTLSHTNIDDTVLAPAHPPYSTPAGVFLASNTLTPSVVCMRWHRRTLAVRWKPSMVVSIA